MNQIPSAVRASSVLWLVAIGAGVFETALVVATAPSLSEVAVGALVRVAIFAVMMWVILRMRAGRIWARWTLAIALGVLGTLSLVIGPIQWLAEGNSLAEALSRTTVETGLFAASRTVHIAAVVSALTLMFRPSANAYFRTRRQSAH